MSTATERTPLRTGGAGGPGGPGQTPTYVFMTNPGRVHRTKIRQFQCCVCAAILGVFVMALVITISYSVDHDDEDTNATTAIPPPQNSSIQTLLTSSWPIPDEEPARWPLPDPDPAALQAALAAGRDELASRAKMEAGMKSMDRDSPSYRANQAVKTRPEATKLAQRGVVEEQATKHLLKASGRDLTWRTPAGQGPRLQDSAACEEEELPLPCPQTPYRSADGTCNNLQHPRTWGVAMRPFRRVLPASYEDGVSAPRTKDLPSAREVSVKIHRPLYRDDPDFTVMLAVWGQFLDHDITATALSQRANGSEIPCCGLSEKHPECLPVRLAAGDPYFHKYNLTCMEFVRSAAAPTCSLGPREQLNQASSFLDGSVVYGPAAGLMSFLRESSSGRLKMTNTPDARELLPVSEDPDDGCNREEMNKRGRYCFMSGDARANENLHLTTMHLLWARQHNRLAGRLQAMNPHWNDERVFQESRKIVSAQLQHITYSEFLPVIIGKQLSAHLELQPKTAGYTTDYDPDIDPTICNSFAASAFRFAHTLLPGLLKLIGNDTSSPEFVELHEMLFDPYSLYSRDGADRALRGAMDTGIERADNYFNPEVTERLFAKDSPKQSIGHGSLGRPACGLDLVSLNVQRGRDHGLPPYPAWREHCGYPRPQTWDDLEGVVDDDSLQRMKDMYKSVDDVDVYTGSLSEYPVEGGLLGQTVTCMLTDQFVRLKRGDRFWYETNEEPQAFTPAQLTQIRKTSLAGVICSTSDGVHSAQPEVMRRAHGGNGRVPCSQIPQPNLRAWVERDGRYVLAQADALPATEHGPAHDDNIPDEIVLVGDQKTSASDPSSGRAVRVGGRATGGAVTSAGSSLWTGALPAALPVPLPAAGVLWTGSLVAAGGAATIKGTYSLEKSPWAPSGEAADDTASGNFKISLEVLWSTAVDDMIDLSGSFSTAVYLRANKRGEVHEPLPHAATNSKGSERFAPVILHGQYSADNATFLWDGNFTLVLPTMASPDPEYLAVSEQEQAQAKAQASAVPTYTTASVQTKSSAQQRVAVKVLSGTVTAKTATGAEETWWDGKLPADIPTSPFNAAKMAAVKDGEPTRPSAAVDGLVWSAELMSSSADSARIAGTFKLPRFMHGNFSGAGVVIEWWSGKFSINVQAVGGKSLDGLVSPSQKFTSPIAFQSMKQDSQPQLALTAAAQEVVDGAVRVPVIFQGTYSPDRKTFSWSGGIVLVFPSSAPAPETPALQLLGQSQPQPQPAMRPPVRAAIAKVVKIGAVVKTGTVTAAKQDAASSAETTVWSGNLPAAIPMPHFSDKETAPSSAQAVTPVYAHGVLWRGTLSVTSTSITLKGTYSLPRYMQPSDNSSVAIQWWKGSFSFTMTPLWEDAYDGLVEEDVTYSSPVYFKTMQADESAAGSAASQKVPLTAFVAATQEEIDGAVRAPVLLQGTVSPDGSTFYWSGNVVIAIPRRVTPPPPPSNNLLQAAAPGVMSSPRLGTTKVPDRKIGIRVLDGSVYAYPEGAWFWRTWWSGFLPTAIPVPVFDSYSDQSAAYPTGPVYHACGAEWTGSLTALPNDEVKLEGKFSLPNYKHSATGLTVTWYYGTFSLRAKLLWSINVNGLIENNGDKFSSPIYFRTQYPIPGVHYPAGTSGKLSLQQFVMDSLAYDDGSRLVPVTMQGHYSEDGATFYWTGDAVLSVPEPRPPNMLLLASDATSKEMAAKGKAGKPNKPPKLFIDATVINGSVEAGVNNGSMYTLWSGTPGVWLPAPPFGEASWNDSQSITWIATLSANTDNQTATFEGTFSMPRYRKTYAGEVVDIWNGRFSMIIQSKWDATLNAAIIKTGQAHHSPVTYVLAKSSPMTFVQVGGGDFGPGSMPIILHGTYAWYSSSWFWWDGDIAISVPLSTQATPHMVQGSAKDKTKPEPKKDDAKVPSKPSKPAKPEKKKQNKLRISANVVGGYVNASVGNSTAANIWSGATPMWLPAPPFGLVVWDVDHPMAVDVKASLSVNATDKTIELQGSFKMPKYKQGANGIEADVWEGTFDLKLKQIWESVIDVTKFKTNSVYSARIVYVPPKASPGMASNPNLMLRGNGNNMLTRSDVSSSPIMVRDDSGSNSATILLQGTYAWYSSYWFWWTGAMTVIIPLDDDPPPTNNLQLKQGASLIARAERKVAFSVVEGKIGAQKENGPKMLLWSGSLPVSIPSSPFDATDSNGTSPLQSLMDPSGMRQGIMWSGALVPTSATEATLEGVFRFPKSVNASSVEWWNGEFSLLLRYIGNSTLDGLIPVNQTFASPLVLKAMADNETIASLLKSPAAGRDDVSVSAMQFVMDSVAAAERATRAPIFLQGSYSADKSTFSWTGNVVLVIPKDAGAMKRPVKKLLKSSPGKSKPKQTSKTKPGTGKTAATPKIGATVMSGSAILKGANSESGWSGEFPVRLPAFAPADASTPMNSHGVLWSGSLKNTSPNTATLSGNFSAPMLASDGDETSPIIEWWSGTFSLQMQLMWNTSVSGIISPSTRYFSPVSYRSSGKALNSSAPSGAELAEQLAALSQEAMDGVQRAPLYLDGTYDAQGSTFLWNGKFIMIFPAPAAGKPKKLSLMLGAGDADAGAGGAKKQVTVGAAVSSGWFTAGGPTSYLSPPMAIPVAAVRKLRPLTWMGSVTRGWSAGSVTVKGTLSTAQYSHDSGVLSVDWVTGSFSISGRLLWNVPVDTIVSPYTNYTSSIHLVNSDSLEEIKTAEDNVPAVWNRIMDKEISAVAGAGKRVPLILQGQFSEDGSTFLWSGNVLIGIPVQ